MVIYLVDSHHFYLQMGVGVGTNTIDELLALWGLHYFAKMKGLSRLQIANYYLGIVNWFMGIFSISFMVLKTWQLRIRALQESFEDIYIHHIHR